MAVSSVDVFLTSMRMHWSNPSRLQVGAPRLAPGARPILHRPVRREQETLADGAHAGRAPPPSLVGGELSLPAQFRQLGHVRFNGFKQLPGFGVLVAWGLFFPASRGDGVGQFLDLSAAVMAGSTSCGGALPSPKLSRASTLRDAVRTSSSVPPEEVSPGYW